MHEIWEVLGHSLMVAGFVFVMMLVIEYLNILTRGRWDRLIREHRWSQYIVAAALGAIPGCLGSFAVIGLYSHRVITFGALVTAMIATTGDAAFVMLAYFPSKAILLFGILAVTGIAAGVLVDVISGRRRTGNSKDPDCVLPVHDNDMCVSFSRKALVKQWRNCSSQRGMMVFFLVVFLLGIVCGNIGHHGHAHGNECDHEWGWVRITMVVTVTIGMFIVSTVPDHFLEEHLWKHIVKVHLWKVFLWTLGAFTVLHFLLENFDLESQINEGSMAMLLLLLSACLVGLIPEVGPHIIFVSLFAQGLIPFSVLIAGSIVQDGHGMLPMLAHSRRAFLGVKGINLAVGLIVGLAGYLMGW